LIKDTHLIVSLVVSSHKVSASVVRLVKDLSL